MSSLELIQLSDNLALLPQEMEWVESKLIFTRKKKLVKGM